MIKNYFSLEICLIATGLCHVETQEERVIKHHRYLLFLRKQAILLTKKRIDVKRKVPEWRVVQLARAR